MCEKINRPGVSWGEAVNTHLMSVEGESRDDRVRPSERFLQKNLSHLRQCPRSMAG